MNRHGITFLFASLFSASAGAQPVLPSKVDLAFNRYYTYDEVLAALRRMESAYPDLVALETIGKSLEGRDLVVATITNEKSGAESDKPAMWIDANVHGNEIQGTEVVLYTAQFLTAAYGVIPEFTRLLDERCFYLMPSQNPDGRVYWFEEANSSSSSRAGARPVDSDDDGLFDEDPPNDLDGDGSITSMWRRDEFGGFIRDPLDPRSFKAVKDKEPGERWTRVGSEGVDDDLDGQINEDGKGGDDLNRNWPTDWQPNHIQGGSALYALSQPEALAIAKYIAARPNIAAVQSYHNAGGMILRGPGAQYLENTYPSSDVAVYDELGKLGEKLLPYYRYMIIWKDLYTVHGGFVNWTAEGLGIVSFTNELWTDSKVFQRDGAGSSEDDAIARDKLYFGSAFTEYAEHDHPTLGRVLIGGPTKWGSRVTPGFLLEEECHRNFAFTVAHAQAMPKLALRRSAVKDLGEGRWAVSVEIENRELIPTRTRLAANRKIGAPDVLEVVGAEVKVIAGGALPRFDDETFEPVRTRPGRIVLEEGIGSRAKRSFRFLVQADAGAVIRFRYAAEKARDLEFEVKVAATPGD
jgi:Zinc carboxypeptidase